MLWGKMKNVEPCLGHSSYREDHGHVPVCQVGAAGLLHVGGQVGQHVTKGSMVTPSTQLGQESSKHAQNTQLRELSKVKEKVVCSLHLICQAKVWNHFWTQVNFQWS